MPKSGKEVVKYLMANEWKLVSQRGSHVKLKKGKSTIIVPVHSNKALGKGLIRAIEKQSGVKIL